MAPPVSVAVAPARVADRLAPFGATVFAEMTRLANEHGAINLGQGLPDFDGAPPARRAAMDRLESGPNQYAPPAGLPELRTAIAGRWRERTGLGVDPDREITVTPGATGALASTFLGLINAGDEVVLFEPFYDSYRANCALAGATPRFVPLRPPTPGELSADPRAAFTFDEAELRAAFGPRTRAVLLNSPHNPTGKVFTRDELSLIAELCVRHDAVAIADEVYEDLVLDEDRPHTPIATLPGMRERTISVGSIGKTFSLTAWKVGWTIAPPGLTAGERSAQQFLIFAICPALQAGSAVALHECAGEIAATRAHFREMRDLLLGTLRDIGLTAYHASGGYFVMAAHDPISAGLALDLSHSPDVAVARWMTEHAGVSPLPPSSFYHDTSLGAPLLRFAFCKREATMREACDRLRRLQSGGAGR